MTRVGKVRETLIRSGFRAVGAVAPGPAGRFAFRLFSSPPHRRALTPGQARMAARMAPLIDRAERRTIAFDGGRVASYSWRSDAGASRGRVMLVHGWSGRALVMTAFAEPLLRQGFDVVALDLPGHGDSDGRRLTLPLGAKAVQAVADAHGGITGVIAHSFGCPISVLAAEGGPPMTHAMAVERLVLIASPNALSIVARRFADRIGLGDGARGVLEAEIRRVGGRPSGGFVVGDMLDRLGKPVLVIHDEGDADVPFVRGQEIVAAASSVARLLPTTGVGHRRIVVAPQAIKAATRFLAGPKPDLALLQHAGGV